MRGNIPKTSDELTPEFLDSLPDMLAFNKHRCRTPNIVQGRVNFPGLLPYGALSEIEKYERSTGKPAAFASLEFISTRKRKVGVDTTKLVRLNIQSHLNPELWVHATMPVPAEVGDVSGTSCAGRLSSRCSLPYARITKCGQDAYQVRVDDQKDPCLYLESKPIIKRV